MIKFFRKIRQNVLNEGKTSKYFKYAIGEIILVVIGILIALQVNNWSENQKDRNEERNALIDLKEEFLYNSNVFKKHLSLKKKVNQQWIKLIDTLSNDNSVNDGSIRRTRSGSDTYILSQSVLDKLLFTGVIDKIENDSLKTLLSSWNYIYKEYEDDEIMHSEFIEKEFALYEMKLIPFLYAKNGTANKLPSPFYNAEDMNQYIINANNDFYYRNLLLRNQYYLNNVINEGDILQKTLNEIITLLDEEIKK